MPSAISSPGEHDYANAHMGHSRPAPPRTCANAAPTSMRSIRRRSRSAWSTRSTTREPQLWLPADPVPSVFLEIAADPKDWQLVAHNYDFERAILTNILVPRHGFQPIPLEVQHCSQRLALANAYPAELDLLAQALGLPYRKDPAARKAMLAVCRPKANRKRKATTVPTWDEDPVKLALLYERCKLDVITTRAVWQSPKLKHLSEHRAPLPDPGRDH